MEFSLKKLPPEAAEELRNTPIDQVAPYVPMPAPVYVFLRRNGKFVSVKGPLDFFTPDELKHLGAYESFFMPKTVLNMASVFQAAGREARALLLMQSDARVDLPPAPFEITDRMTRLLGPLWGRDLEIEPFFLAIFAQEICDPLAPETLQKARENDVETFEKALLVSAWAVFLALHLGNSDLGFLSALRLEAFNRALGARSGHAGPQAALICDAALSAFHDGSVRTLSARSLSATLGHLALKMEAKLKRVSEDFTDEAIAGASIYGPSGFIFNEAPGDV